LKTQNSSGSRRAEHVGKKKTQGKSRHHLDADKTNQEQNRRPEQNLLPEIEKGSKNDG